MSTFTKKLTTTYIGGGKRKVERTFGYWTGKEEFKGLLIKVPGVDTVGEEKAFVTDFASVPWPARMLIPKDGDYNQAAVLHDYLYYMLGRVRVVDRLGNESWYVFTRKECDEIFKRAMRTLHKSSADIKIPTWKRRVMYRAVRLGGWKGWNRRKKQLKKEKK